MIIQMAFELGQYITCIMSLQVKSNSRFSIGVVIFDDFIYVTLDLGLIYLWNLV